MPVGKRDEVVIEVTKTNIYKRYLNGFPFTSYRFVKYL